MGELSINDYFCITLIAYKRLYSFSSPINTDYELFDCKLFDYKSFDKYLI